MKLVQYWTLNDMYSYAFVVPFISALLVWAKRPELERTPAAPSLAIGSAVLAIGLLMVVVGRVSSTNLVEEMSLVVTVCGLTLLLFGTRVFGVLSFPIGYLIAMVPFWEYLTNRLHPPFQIYSATVGVELLKTAGIPVLREGFFIHLPNVTLEVAQACSGINYLIAVFCVGIPMTYLFVKSWPKRVFIVLAAIVIALLSNAIRVAVVSMFAYHGIRGADGDIHGPFALFRSLLVSGIGFMAIFGLVFRLAEKDGPVYSLWSPEDGRRRMGVAAWTFRPVAAVLAIIMLGGAVAFGLSHRVAAVPLTGDLRALPLEVAHWKVRGVGSSFDALEAVRFDDKLSRTYTAPDGAELSLFLGYFQTQEQGRELAGYTVRTALGNGEPSTYVLPSSERHHVNDFLASSNTGVYHVTYWYVLDGRVVSSEYLAKLYTAWDSLIHRRSNGALVVVKTKVQDKESVEVARVRVRGFLEDFVTMAKDYISRS